MKIALFAAVPEEVGTLSDLTTFTGIGRENATRKTLQFIESQACKDFTIVNIGTVGSPNKPVGSILNISQIISAGEPFNNSPMLLERLPLPASSIDTGVLYSSDCFVSPTVFTEEYLEDIKLKADCFDMESSAIYTIANVYGIPFVSYKIVSDNLDVSIQIWKERVHKLSKRLDVFVRDIFRQLEDIEKIEFIHG